jgi:hypothetical protein
MNQDDLRLRLTNIARQGQPHLTEDEQERIVELALGDNPAVSQDERVRTEAWDKYAKSISESYGILSLAGIGDHALLWSHYADSHRGYCVELDARRLATELFDLARTDEEAVDVHSINYADVLPIVLPSSDDEVDRERHMTLLTTKSDVWTYEQEWRFIWIGKTALPKYIDREVIRRVIIGCQMPQEHRQGLIDLVKSKLPKTEVWEAVRSHTEFRLELRPA